MCDVLFAKQIQIIIFLQLLCMSRSSLEFNQNYFGVTFDPFIKQPKNTKLSVWSYDFKSVKTMLTVISTKFNKVLVEDDFTIQEYYIYNYTYDHQTLISIRVGEAAAMINKKNGRKTLTVMYEAIQSGSAKQLETAVSLSFEAAEKANKIFPGTFEAVMIRVTDTDLLKSLQILQSFKARAAELEIKIETDMDCINIIDSEKHTLNATEIQMINASDYVGCDIICSDSRIVPADCFASVSNDFLKFKDMVHAINPKAETIGETRWYNNVFSRRENDQNFQKYWEEANEWTLHQNYKIFLKSAFDKPSDADPLNRHLGWWRLTDNAKINDIEGYVEKINDADDSLPTVPSNKTGAIGVESTKKNNGTDSEPSFNGWSHAAIPIAGIGGTVTVLLSVLVLFFLVRYKMKRTIFGANEIKDFLFGISNKNGGGEATLFENTIGAPYDNSLEIPKDKLHIDIGKVLGSGEFGLVVAASIDLAKGESIDVALKIAKNNCNSSVLKGLLSEIKIMTYLGKHPNIVILKGAYTAELANGVVYIATELCPLGSLEGHLRQGDYSVGIHQSVQTGYVTVTGLQEMELTTKSRISLGDMVRWSYEIACGMEYLEKKHVVHADLATRNVLLTSDKTAKIADFGLSRRMYNYTNYVKTKAEPLPWRWMAIEALRKMDFSSKSDVWSFGITLWEIFSKGDTPYPGLCWSQSFVTRLINGLRPDCPSFATPEIYNIMRDCWNFNPKERPSFTELVSFIDVVQKKSEVPAEENFGENK